MAYSDQFELSQNPDFVKRLRIIIVKVAIDVQAEATDVLQVPVGVTYTKQELHDLRAKLAYKVLSNPVGYAELMAYGVSANVVVSAESTDGDLEFTVSSMWNAYSIGAV